MRWFLAASLLSACTHSAPRAQSSVPPPVSTSEVAAATPKPHAPWLEPPLEAWRTWSELDIDAPVYDAPEPPHLAPQLLTVGEHSLLVSTRFGEFVLDDAKGISGPLSPPPEADYYFISGSNLFIADDAGTLYRGEGFDEVGKVPGAQGWVGGTEIVATISAGRVMASTDGGHAFSAVFARKNERVIALDARTDDTLVIETEQTNGRSTFTSRDHGKTWQRAIALPLGLKRVGGWIYGVDRDCSGKIVWAVLAADGRTWVAKDPLPDSDEEARIANMKRAFDSSPALVTYEKAPTPSANDPKPPTSGTLYPGYPICKEKLRYGTGRKTKVVKMLDTGTDVPEFDCQGIGCVRGGRSLPMERTRTSAFLFHDGLHEGEAIVRMPHVLFMDDDIKRLVRSVRAVSAPASCTPKNVSFRGGLVVLQCSNGALHTATAVGVFHHEADFEAPFDVGDFEMIDDGTAMFASYPTDGKARAWVRAPLAIGANAWRSVTRSDAVAYVLRDAGVVDVVIREGDYTFSLLTDAPGLVPTMPLVHVTVGGDLWCLGRADGRYVGLIRNERGTFDRVVFHGTKVEIIDTVLDGHDHADKSGRCGF